MFADAPLPEDLPCFGLHAGGIAGVVDGIEVGLYIKHRGHLGHTLALLPNQICFAQFTERADRSMFRPGALTLCRLATCIPIDVPSEVRKGALVLVLASPWVAMNNSRIFDAIVSRPAAVAAAGLVILFILGLAVALRPHRKAPDMTLYTNSAPVQTTRYERPTVPVVSFSPQPPPAPPAPLPPPPVKTNSPLVALHYHVQLPPDTNPPPLGLYAPAGRLIRCVLVNTVDSANIDTPIIALVTDDLWHDGRIVIPAGTEVHGKASIDHSPRWDDPQCAAACGNGRIDWKSSSAGT